MLPDGNREEAEGKTLNTILIPIIGQVSKEFLLFIYSQPAYHLLVVSVSVSDSWMKLACPIKTEKNLIQSVQNFKIVNIFRLNAN